MQGQTMFIWQIKEVLKGDLAAIVKRAKALGITTVLVKIANGGNAYNLRPDNPDSPKIYYDDVMGPFVEAMRAAGIVVIGWHYIYGFSAVVEANRAIERCNKFSLDAYVIDAESEFKEAGKADIAKSFMTILRASLKIPIGLTSYRFPTLHPEFPWKEFLKQCDFHMPQVYWQNSHNAGNQLERAIIEYRALEVSLGLKPMPIYPIGAAYHENGWQPTPAEMQEFFKKAIDLGLQAVSWWEWGCALRAGLETVFETMTWPGAVQVPEPDPEPETIEDRLSSLEKRVTTLDKLHNLL
jgi:hypothetical protein